MRPGILLFLATIFAGTAAWVFAVIPVHVEATGLATRLAGEPIADRVRLAADPPPTAAEAARLAGAMTRLATPPAAPAPKGLSEEVPGTFAGRLPWEEVLPLLAWSSDQPRPVIEIEVRALPEDPSRAACRVVLGQ